MFNESFVPYKEDLNFIDFRLSTAIDKTFSVTSVKRSIQTFYWDSIAGHFKRPLEVFFRRGGQSIKDGYGYFLNAFFEPREINIRESGQHNIYAAEMKEQKLEGKPYNQAAALVKLSNSYYSDMNFSERRMDVIMRLKLMLDERKMRYKVFLNPVHKGIVAQRDRYVSRKLYSDFIDRLYAVFPTLVNLNDGALSNKSNYYHFDAEYFKPSVAALFVPKIINAFCLTYKPSNPNALPCDYDLEQK